MGSPTAPTPGAPIATVAGIKITPKLLAVGVIALAVIVGVFVYMNMNSKPGSITVSPSTFSCSATTPVTSTMRLPSSLKETDQLTYQLDGVPAVTSTVADNFTKQSDGSWLAIDTSSASSSCEGPSGAALSVGTHVMRILDASGKVLAEGSYTLTP
jgi:hypothetical protein